MSGVYQIKVRDRIYIGSTTNFKARWWRHRAELRKGIHINKQLQRCWNKYGGETFEFSIVEEVPPFRPALLAREQHYLDTLNPSLNHLKIAGSCLGVKRSEEFKNKLRKPRPIEVREKIRASLTGKKLSEEHKQNISKNHKGMLGKSHSEETKIKMKKPKSEEHKLHMRIPKSEEYVNSYLLGQNNPNSRTNRALRVK